MFFLIDRLITVRVHFSGVFNFQNEKQGANVLEYFHVLDRKVTDAVSSEKNFIFFLGNNS